MPFLLQPSQFILACDRHRNMLDCIPPWLGTKEQIYKQEYNAGNKKEIFL